MSKSPFRNRIITRLIEDLVGPMSENEILSDRPTQRYSTGILYPRGSRIQTEEDEDGGLVVNEAEDTASTPEDGGVSLHAALKPSVAGLSFAVQPAETFKILRSHFMPLEKSMNFWNCDVGLIVI